MSVPEPADAARPRSVARRLGVPPEVGARSGLIVAVVGDTIGVGLMLPISLLYFTLTTDLPLARIGLLLTLATLLSLPMGLVAGELTQRFGAKQVMVANNVVSALGFVAYYFDHNALMVFLGAFVVSSADRMYWSCWPPYLRGLPGDNPFDTWFPFLEALKAGCMAAGAGLTALFLGVVGSDLIKVLVLVNIATCLLSSVLLARQPVREVVERGPVAHTRTGWAEVFGDLRYPLLAVGQALMTPLGLVSAIAFPVFFVRDWGMDTWIGPFVFTLGALFTFFAQSAVAARIPPRARGRVVTTGSLLAGLSMTIMLVATLAGPPAPGLAVPVAVAVIVVLCFAGTLILPTTNSILMDSVTDRNAARVTAVFHTGTSVAMAVSPAMMSWLLAAPAALWVVLAALSLAGATCFAAVARAGGPP